jgi:DNA polymerase
MARRAAIPVSLAKCAEFLKLGIDKDARGKALIGIFSDQNKQVLIRNGKESRKTHSPILENPIPWNWTMTVAGETLTVAEAWKQFKDYCRQDVRVEQRVHKALAKFEILGDELQGFQFDLRMNDLGAPVNVEALKHAATILDYHREALEKEFSDLTGLMPTQTAKVLEWLRGEGYPGENLQAETMEKWLGNDALTASGARALDIRSQLSFAAVKKVGAMLDTVCPDGRMRGLFTWHGAQRTGRWTSQGPQLQNAKKPTIKDADEAYLHIRQGFDPEAFEILHGNP